MFKLKILILLIACFKLMANDTTENLYKQMIEKDSLVCVGLDPDISKFPKEIIDLKISQEEKVYIFLKNVIDLTKDHVCCYKIQKAFFDIFDEGHNLLKKVIAYAKSYNILTFVDCKIGDIDNTMNIYMKNLFDLLQSDGVVINPYMGDDVLFPFMTDKEKTGIVLVQTSNKSAEIIQNIKLKDDSFLWEKILSLTIEKWNVNNNLIVVLSSNSVDYDYKKIRKKIPNDMPILLAGFGAQGGNLNSLKELLNEEKIGVFINSSRGILYNYDPDSKNWTEKIKAAVIDLKNSINKIRYEN